MRPDFHSFACELVKIAEDKEKNRAVELAKILGVGALGFGAGTAVGMGTGYAADAISKKLTGKAIPKGPIMHLTPLLGAGAGIAYSVYKAREQEALQNALKGSAASSRT